VSALRYIRWKTLLTLTPSPKKAEKEFDPEVIRRVEERLAKLKTSD
jgi:hypothetical protein